MGDTRSNRFSYEPIFNKDGTVRVAELTPHDDARFIATAAYDYLFASDIAALSGGDEASVTNRYNLLKREPNRWVDIAAPMIENRAATKTYRNDFLAYSNSSKTEQRLKARGLLIPRHGFSGPFVHKLTACSSRASYDIAIRRGAPATIKPFYKIMEDPQTPAATRAKPTTAHRIPVEFTYKGERIKKNVVPDVYPYELKTHEEVLLLQETDCNSESISARDGNDIDLKFIQYIEIFLQDIIRTRYNYTKSYVTITTTSTPHMHGMMARLVELTKDKTSLRRRFLFKYFPSMRCDERHRSDGYLLTEPWERAGMPPFDLLTGKSV